MGKICGLMYRVDKFGDWVILARDKCGQLTEKTIGTITISPTQSLYLLLQYMCEAMEGCEMEFILKFIDANGKGYPLKHCPKRCGEGMMWYDLPAPGEPAYTGGELVEGTLHIGAVDAGTGFLQDTVSVKIHVPQLPPEAPPEEPEVPPEVPPEAPPGKVAVTATLKAKGFRGCLMRFSDTSGKTLKEIVAHNLGDRVSYVFDPQETFLFTIGPKPGILGAQAKCSAKSGETEDIRFLFYVVSISGSSPL